MCFDYRVTLRLDNVKCSFVLTTTFEIFFMPSPCKQLSISYDVLLVILLVILGFKFQVIVFGFFKFGCHFDQLNVIMMHSRLTINQASVEATSFAS